MFRYLIASVLTGILFGIADGVINANPLAIQLMEYYQPIARAHINVPAGIAIDLVYGFAISGIYLLLMPALPGNSGVVKGLTYGLGMWFFRVLMGAVSSWMMYTVPVKTLVYLVLSGLIEMTLLGLLNGLILGKRRLLL